MYTFFSYCVSASVMTSWSVCRLVKNRLSYILIKFNLTYKMILYGVSHRPEKYSSPVVASLCVGLLLRAHAPVCAPVVCRRVPIQHYCNTAYSSGRYVIARWFCLSACVWLVVIPLPANNEERLLPGTAHTSGAVVRCQQRRNFQNIVNRCCRMYTSLIAIIIIKKKNKYRQARRRAYRAQMRCKKPNVFVVK